KPSRAEARNDNGVAVVEQGGTFFDTDRSRPMAGEFNHAPRYWGKTVAQWAEALKHPDGIVRRRAARALGRVRPPGEAADPALLDALKEAWLRYGEIRQADGEAVPLDEILSRPEAFAAIREFLHFCKEARKALGRIGPHAIPLLMEALKATDPDVRKEAHKALR